MQDYKLALSKLCELKVQVLHHWLTAKQVGLGTATTCMSLTTIIQLCSHPPGMKTVDSFAAYSAGFVRQAGFEERSNVVRKPLFTQQIVSPNLYMC